MATRRELPADVAAALDRVPAARSRFAALPPERQGEWLAWVDGARGRRGRAARIDEMTRRILPSTATEEELAEPVRPPPERYWWLWLLLLLVLVAAGLLIWWLLSRGNDKSTVPDVIGLKSSVAAQRIHDKHLNVTPVTGQSKRPPNVVFAQAPGSGTQLRHGQTVTISISSGQVAVPNVTSQPLEQAQTTLHDAGFGAQVKRVASSRPKNIVITQSPAAGVTAATGTTVQLTVSSGAKPVVVPQVVGQTQGSAVNALTGAGLKPVLHNVGSSKPAGVVVAQKPPAGKEVDKGSKVTLNVSTGTPSTTTTTTTTTTTPTTTAPASTTAAKVNVPRVTGLAQTPALRQLNARGLHPQVVYRKSSQPANRVLEQAPAAGTSARRNSKVSLVVSAGPNPQPSSPVPNVVGQDQATAANNIKSAGFKVVVLNRPVTKSTQDGVVVDEQPRSGSGVPDGSQVTIFIGRFQSG
ncbi:MAG TPA: PASTA domain-containing protein [Gaiellaceae bacterium]|nr:PASTA domain-containing protein [Gaiellaceae bacterium]